MSDQKWQLPISTWEDLENEAPPEWLAKPWVATRNITEVSGRAKGTGKTTWLRAMVRAILKRQPFLGEPTVYTPVVYLTEESGALVRGLKREGLWRIPGLHIVKWTRVRGQKWGTVVRAALDYAKRIGARLLIIDTFSRFTLAGGVDEWNPTHQYDVMGHLQVAADEGLAVVMVRHDRKTGGSKGTAARGSTAIGGSVDIVLHMRPGGKSKTRRVIEGEGRFDEIPDLFSMEFDVATREYTAEDQKVDYTSHFGQPVSVVAFAQATGLPRATADRTVKDLLDQGLIMNAGGSGKRGDPTLFVLTGTP